MWLTALVIGFAGSLHCLGMCSPLALAVTSMSRSVIINRLLYNGGRIFTYGILGAIIAMAGLAFPLARFQNLLSFVLGIALLFVGIMGIGGLRFPFITPLLLRFSSALKTLFSKILKRKNQSSILLLGALNGLLPCGLTFLALTYCITLKGPVDGFNFMLLFGLGTLPVMLGAMAFIPMIAARFKIHTKSMITTMLILSGVILIARVFMVHLPHIVSSKESLIDIVMCR